MNNQATSRIVQWRHSSRCVLGDRSRADNHYPGWIRREVQSDGERTLCNLSGLRFH